MAITKRPKPVDETGVQEFIAGAPDAAGKSRHDPARPAVVSTRKQAISLTLPPDLIQRADAVAGRLHLSRAAAIALALTLWVEAEEQRGH
ncbi:hypothetical protein AQ915_20580 [Burkholderia pseudomallei]|uniref:hypothetical protein n=1 Tax=Burkholderia pseudomallei TaxID=28450 RepID=UPI000976F329|nr:hypothetical protein [Burkholderia pseudomallei]ONC30054.1 hypothetical protein AQ915_20580 [Burkholderia pseudomallei]